MSWLGEATGALGLLSRGWDGWRSWRDPARRSAQRLIRAFEAYGVSRQQIIRLVPAALAPSRAELSMADFSTPEQLKSKLSPALLDWATDHLNLRRDWLDGRADVPPHLVVDFYTQPARYGAWLRARQLEMPHAQRWLAVWKAQGSPLGPHADGPLCVVYEEVLPGLDDADWARHWLLADGWSMGHLPCIESLAALVLLAQRAGVTVIGKELPSRELRRLQEGRALVAELEPKTRGRWHPEDLVMPPRQHDSAWLQAVRQAARRRLSDETHER
jgi:hypothetical protein